MSLVIAVHLDMSHTLNFLACLQNSSMTTWSAYLSSRLYLMYDDKKRYLELGFASSMPSLQLQQAG